MKWISIAIMALFLTACTVKYEGNITGDAIFNMPKVTCADSDKGIKADVPGYVNGVSERNEAYQFEDECYGTILTEFYCYKNMPKSKNVNCEGKCRSGQCV